MNRSINELIQLKSKQGTLQQVKVVSVRKLMVAHDHLKIHEDRTVNTIITCTEEKGIFEGSFGITATVDRSLSAYSEPLAQSLTQVVDVCRAVRLSVRVRLGV